MGLCTVLRQGGGGKEGIRLELVFQATRQTHNVTEWDFVPPLHDVEIGASEIHRTP